MFMQTAFIALIWIAAGALWVMLYRLRERQHSWRRLESGDSAAMAARDTLDEQGRVARWLYLAGYRSPDATAWFACAMLLAVLAGALAMFALYRLDFVARTAAVVSEIPGGIGDVFTPLVYCAPWFAFGLLLLLPIGIVQRKRRRRVEQLEQDLPLALELLATLSEAGLGFDSALARIMESGLSDRALAAEFRSFQADLVAGRARAQALRRLSRRLEVSTMAILVSALVQAEQLGTGIALVLRRQADDLRERRRERANAFAASLAIKRMFPLVICFLPGLFIWILGPAFTQLFRMADTIIRSRHP